MTDTSGGIRRYLNVRTLKAAIIVVAVVLVTIVIFQNTEPLTVRLLFATVTMPRALLLFVMLVIGFALGVLFPRLRTRR